MPYDVDRIRSAVPRSRRPVGRTSTGPGGTQTPRSVGEAVAAALTGPLSNRGTSSPSEQNAEDAVAGFRAAMADLLGADPRGIVEGRSATQLVYDFSRHLARDWGAGDEIVVTRLDHDSNVRPWVQAAERTGATRALDRPRPADRRARRPRGGDHRPHPPRRDHRGLQPDRHAPRRCAGSRMPPTRRARWSGSTACTRPPTCSRTSRQLGADFFVCSPYKFLGPHCGVLAAAPELLATIRPDKLLPATDDVPERFEFGTLPYELLAGVTAAVEALAALDATASGTRRERLTASYAALHEHETASARPARGRAGRRCRA